MYEIIIKIIHDVDAAYAPLQTPDACETSVHETLPDSESSWIRHLSERDKETLRRYVVILRSDL